MSPGRVPASPLMRKDDPKLTRARWADTADTDSGEDEHKPLIELPASSESRRRADLCAEGCLEGSDIFGERVLLELTGCPDVRSDALFIQWCETV